MDKKETAVEAETTEAGGHFMGQPRLSKYNIKKHELPLCFCCMPHCLHR